MSLQESALVMLVNLDISFQLQITPGDFFFILQRLRHTLPLEKSRIQECIFKVAQDAISS